jgi:hypothetical protein
LEVRFVSTILHQHFISIVPDPSECRRFATISIKGENVSELPESLHFPEEKLLLMRLVPYLKNISIGAGDVSANLSLTLDVVPVSSL